MFISVTVCGLVGCKRVWQKSLIGNEISYLFLHQFNANPASNKKLNLSHSQLISVGSLRNDESVIGGDKLSVLHVCSQESRLKAGVGGLSLASMGKIP